MAAEAVRAIQLDAMRYLQKPPISLIHTENHVSIQLAKAVGAQFERETQFRAAVWQVYRHPRVG